MRPAKRKADGIEHGPSRPLAELAAQRTRLTRLKQRLEQGLACHCQELLKVREALPFERLFLAQMAYYRDKIISGWILLHFAKAVANEDSLSIPRLKVFWAKWHRADKGPEWKSEAFCRALNLLRKIEVIRRLFGDTPESSSIIESDFIADLRNPLTDTESDGYEKALARAKAFRARRHCPESRARTDEFDPRTDIMAFGIACQLHGKTNVGFADDLKNKYEPGYTGTMTNYQKKLDDCFVPFTRRRVGRPRRK